jgi:hypothetical protein
LARSFAAVALTQDEASKRLRAVLKSAAGSRACDQDPDASSGQVFGSEAEKTFVRLHRLASDRLAPEDQAEAVTLIQHLFGDTASDGNGMTADLLR